MAEIIWKDRKRIFFGLPWTFTKYSISEDRLFISTGFFSVKEDEVRLYRIMDVSLERKLWQRMCGLGTIKCCSADKTMGDFEIKNIKKSREVKEMLSNMVEDERTKKKVSSREFMDHESDEFDDYNEYDDHDTY
ncbi:Bacterial membrane flanked domain [uncultured Coprococcus sp.]|uniref:PH domain-containing protein n=1 Tax=Coprococcus ammoniilyticus TaxID=2981785 RepID=UPI000822FE8C|nr:PH domain-containing protein [Coprococcus ammoniilyticus]MCU6730432.1 PH domain-containing protein [Coprococcus ammoniilyticus]SCH46389.1 Bacterial membrane flanked domain [uncultured Coprococcus sp.]